ncbi:MAG: copper chaperone PCu(A)C [Marinosulfonomonas sp.]|nr:copper chaperone PCu(A)C [Marinosulfonomonas sp.]
MKRTIAFSAVLLSLTLSAPVFADVAIQNPYVRTSSPAASSGAAFMEIVNDTDQADVLISAASDVAAMVELHTHIQTSDGVMQMRAVEGGIAVAAGETHLLKRGGDHVMFMGLNRSLAQGDMVKVTLTFEKAGDIVVEIPVDLER